MSHVGPALDYERAANAAIDGGVHWIVEIGDCPTERYRQLALLQGRDTGDGLQIVSAASERPAVMARATLQSSAYP